MARKPEQTSTRSTTPRDTREMTSAECGSIGGQRTAQLVAMGKLYEQEHAAEQPPSKSRKR